MGEEKQVAMHETHQLLATDESVPVMSAEAASIHLRAFLDGGESSGELREAVRLYADQHTTLEHDAKALGVAWDELTTCLRELSQQASALSGVRYDSWHPDEFVYGHIIGEALTWRHTSTVLAMIANAAILRKAAHAGTPDNPLAQKFNPNPDLDARGFVRTKATAVTGYTLINMRRLHEHPYSAVSGELPLAFRTAIVVGAGPSLADNGHLIKEAQAKGAAVICVNASAPILTELGVTPDVMVIRESLDTSDQVVASDARLVVMDISVHPHTWDACKDREARWYLPLYPRHGVWYRRLGVRPLGSGTAALTAAVAHVMKWGAQEIVLVGVDLAFDEDDVYHPAAPRGEEQIEMLGPDAVRFSGREKDRARCEASGQPIGPDELRVTRCIASDFSSYIPALVTWENQRVWLQAEAQRHGRVQCTNASGGGGIIGWTTGSLESVIERLSQTQSGIAPAMELPGGVRFHESISEQILDDLRREVAVYENLSREMTEPAGPDIKHLHLSGLEMRDGHRLRFGVLEAPLLTPVLAAAPLLAEDMYDNPPQTIELLRRSYEIHQEAAERASELLK